MERTLKPFRRILLVNPPMASIGAEFMMEDIPLRLEYLAGYVRSQVDLVEVLDFANIKLSLPEAIKKYQPDLVGISINYISTHANGVALAEVAHAAGVPVVLGGYQATAMAEHFVSHSAIDYVVRGEGEETFRALVSGQPPEEIDGLSFKQDGEVVHNSDRALIGDLDSIPLPDRSRRGRKYKLPFADLDSNVATAYDMIITSRGCWGRCTFCTEGLMTDGTQRYRQPAKVIEELDEIIKLHKGKRIRIHIADPNFAGKQRITEELYERMIEWRKNCGQDVRFFVSLRPSAIASNREMTKKMVQAGIDYLFVGLETPNNDELRRVKKGGETRERQELAAKYLRQEGAEIMSNFLIGLPSQTPEDILGLVDYAKSLELADCYFSVVTPLPGSELYNEAVEKGILLETDVTKYRLYDTVMKHDILTRAKVREMCVRANAKWYDDLMLPAERRRAVANGNKRKLYDFAGKFQVLVNFFSFLGGNAENEFKELDPSMLVVDMPNPRLRQFTTQHPINEFIEMRRFLRVLGEQKIRVTLQSKGKDIVSWVAHTTPRSIDYLDAMHGAPAEAMSIVVNVPMDPGALVGGKMLRRILEDNPSISSRVSLLRLVAAAGSEVAQLYLDRSREAVKNGAHDLLEEGKRRLRELIYGREPVAAAPPPPPQAKADCARPGPISAGRLTRKVPTVRARVTQTAG
jgi:anaerobic magnesium-protoporphyrin IX monomethyl ester cyclase